MNHITSSFYDVREQTRAPNASIWDDGCVVSADWHMLMALDGDGYTLARGERLEVRYTIREISSGNSGHYRQITDAEQTGIVAALIEALPDAVIRKHYDGEVIITVMVTGGNKPLNT